MWPNDVTKKDLRIDKYRGSGAGGQKRNKTESAVRILHIPTGIMACAEDQRNYTQNLKNAWKRLCDKLVPTMKAQFMSSKHYNNNEVRVYREKDHIVKDYRLNKTYDYYDVLTGNQLDEIIDNLICKK